MNEYDDVIVTTTEVALGWLDRVRVLVRGSLVVQVRTLTQHEVGRVESRSRVEVPRILPARLRRDHIAEAGASAEERPK